MVKYGCESWTTKKAEHRRIDAFELWCWRWLLRVPWTSRRTNQSTLKEIHLNYSLEALMLKLKLQYFGHLMQRAVSFEKTPMLGKMLRAGGEGADRGCDGWMASLTQWIWDWVDSGSWWWTQGLACCGSLDCKELDTTERLNWTDFNLYPFTVISHYYGYNIFSEFCRLRKSSLRVILRDSWHIYLLACIVIFFLLQLLFRCNSWKSFHYYYFPV